MRMVFPFFSWVDISAIYDPSRVDDTSSNTFFIRYNLGQVFPQLGLDRFLSLCAPQRQRDFDDEILYGTIHRPDQLAKTSSLRKMLLFQPPVTDMTVYVNNKIWASLGNPYLATDPAIRCESGIIFGHLVEEVMRLMKGSGLADAHFFATIEGVKSLDIALDVAPSGLGRPCDAKPAPTTISNVSEFNLPSQTSYDYYQSKMTVPIAYPDQNTTDEREGATTLSAVEKVINTVELLDNIFLRLKPRDALCTARVHRAFYNHIYGDTETAKALFLSPRSLNAPKTFLIDQDYFLASAAHGLLSNYTLEILSYHSTSSKAATMTLSFSVRGERPATPEMPSWRKLLIVQPPIKFMKMSVPDFPPKAMNSRTGITLGCIYDAAKEMREEHRKRFGWGPGVEFRACLVDSSC